MFTAAEIIPLHELTHRRIRCRALMSTHCPEAGGLFAFSRAAIYYLTGTLANGIFWLPLEGEPLLLVRKGLDRARLESPFSSIVPFRSYGDLAHAIAGHSAPLPPVIAAEQAALPWNLAQMLTSRLPEHRFIAGDTALARARAVKTLWELEKIRYAGSAHRKAVCELLPLRIHPGMSEREISLIVWELFFSLGAAGPARMSGFGEEVFLGHICAGETGNYPSHYNGPLGLMGDHPALPFMGNPAVIWEKSAPLAIDTCFTFQGYNTDKTQLYFAGKPGSLPPAAQKAHDFCLEIEAIIAAKLRGGAVPAELYELSLAMVEKAGLAKGYMGLSGNKVSFIGHGIGLAVDEWPVIAPRFEVPLEVNTVIALEPKIGIPGFGMVGSENTYLVTPTGGHCLTGPVDAMMYMGE